jgi:predicted kinase
MAKCYQLIGVPGSGKSTWVKNQLWARDCEVVSSDLWLDVFAQQLNLTYSEVFGDFANVAVKAMMAQVQMAARENRDIIWDQTNVSVDSRKKKFATLPDYEHIAVVFSTPAADELQRRLANRPGKLIPDHVLRHMIDSWQDPRYSEGFAEIWTAG